MHLTGQETTRVTGLPPTNSTIFGRYRMRAQRAAVAVSSHGQITGYFVGPEEYEEFKRFRESRRSFATADLPEEKFNAIRTSRMDPRHVHLDKLLDPK